MTRMRGSRYLARKKRNGIWQIEFTIGGRRVRESTGTADKAAATELAEARYAAEWRRANGLALSPVPAIPRSMSIGQALDRFASEVCAQTRYGRGSEISHLSVLRRGIGGDQPLSHVTNATVSDLVANMLSHGLGPATVNRYITTLGKLCARARDVWGVDVGDWHPRHHRQAEPPGRQTYLTSEQAGALLDACCGHLRPIVYLVLSTGLRRDNAVRLTWEQVSLDMRRIIVTQKGDRPLGVDLTDGALAMLAGIPGERQGAVFRYGAVPCACKACTTSSLRGKPITSIRRPFAAAVRACGLDHLSDDDGGLRVHDLRHTFASALHSATGDLLLVRDALGHASVRTTQRYAHLAPGRRRDDVNQAVGAFLLSPQDRKGEVA